MAVASLPRKFKQAVNNMVAEAVAEKGAVSTPPAGRQEAGARRVETVPRELVVVVTAVAAARLAHRRPPSTRSAAIRVRNPRAPHTHLADVSEADTISAGPRLESPISVERIPAAIIRQALPAEHRAGQWGAEVFQHCISAAV
jgi:hypothetical protein